MITLREYLEKLNKLAEANSEVLEYPLIYSQDDEGNRYNKVLYNPCITYYDREEHQVFDVITEEETKLLEKVICIN